MRKSVIDPAPDVSSHIVMLRGQRVLLDEQLAQLYGIPTRRLNEQLKRNRARFPTDFAFDVTRLEYRNLKSQFATSSWGGRRKLPVAFTEHGAIMAAMILNSDRAVQMSVYVVRAFLKLREVLSSNAELARKLEELERSMSVLDSRTRRQFEEVYSAIRALMRQPDPPSRPIGFTAPIK